MSTPDPQLDAQIYRGLEEAKESADLGQNAAALARLVELRDLAPEDPRVLGNLTAFQLHQNLFQDAMATLRAWEAVEPESPLAQYHFGLAFAGMGDAWQASERYRKALTLRPDLSEAAFELAQLLKGTERASEAFEACMHAAERLFEHRAFRDAVALYTQAFSIQPPSPAQAYKQGMAFLELEQFGEARRAFEFVRDNGRDAERANAINALAVVALREGELDAADGLLSEAIAAQSVFPQAYNNRGNLRSRQGRAEEAIEAYAFATRQFPGYKEAWFNMALELERACRVADALAAYDQVVRLDGKHAPAHFARARTLLRAGRYREGWAGYLWRWAALNGRANYCPDPRRNDGSALPIPRKLNFRNAGARRVVLLPEPLPAEELMFARFVPLLVERGMNVQLAASERIGGMLVECASLPMFDGAFRTDDMLIPTGDIPYLLGLEDPAAVPAPLPLASTSLIEPQLLAQRLAAAGEGPYLAVSWRSVLSSANANPSALTAEQVAQWVRAWPGTAVSVQPDAPAEECENIARLAGKPLVALGDVVTTPSRLAALFGQMQQFAGVSGLPMHIAAGCGLPMEVLVRAGDEWCLGAASAGGDKGSSQSLWYPAASLAGGATRADIDLAVQAIANALVGS